MRLSGRMLRILNGHPWCNVNFDCLCELFNQGSRRAQQRTCFQSCQTHRASAARRQRDKLRCRQRLHASEHRLGLKLV